MTVLRNAVPDSGQKRVTPESRAYEFLPNEQLLNPVKERFRVNVNSNGKKTLSRFLKDNKQVIFTEHGRSWLIFNELGEWRNVVKKNGKMQRVLVIKSRKDMLQKLRHSWENILHPFISYYDPEILKLYTDTSTITPRSVFFSKKYYEKMSSYGRNHRVSLPPKVKNSILSFMNEHYFETFTKSAFDFNLGEEFEKKKWLVHIKTGKNSGYPFFQAQDKQWMASTILPRSIKIMEAYIKNRKSINWSKLLFTPGSRTERKYSARVICMAPAVEKPISALINSKLDEHIGLLHVNLPRKFGSFDNLAKELMSHKGRYFAKDWDGFDTSIPLEFFILLADWFYMLGTMFGYLMAFELDLIINAMMLLSPKLLFKILSLPSGIGITQFIGSLIHEILDYVSGLLALLYFVVHQSDDTSGKGDFTDREIMEIISWFEETFKMKISPIGKKSMLSDHITLLLQKFVNDDEGIWHGHELRAFTNRFLRERIMNDDEDLATLLGLKIAQNKKAKGTLRKIQGARGLLGNLASMGVNAPMLPVFLYQVHGKKASYFSEYEIKVALTSLEEWQTEEHKLPTDNAWLRGYIDFVITEIGWDKLVFGKKFNPQRIQEILFDFGRQTKSIKSGDG